MKKYAWVLAGAAVLLAMWVFIPNMPGGRKTSDGKELSMRYCSSCHLYPEPGLLARDIWVNGVLPEMGLRLGIGDKNVLLNRMPLKQYDHLIKLGIYPDKPLIPIKDWLKIVSYYRDHAPASPTPQAAKDPVHHGLERFTLLPILADSPHAGVTTMARFMPGLKQVWLGSRRNDLGTYDLRSLRQIDSIRMPSPIVDAIPGKESLYLGIGNMLPNEDRNGRLFSMDARGDHAKLILDSLHRPVQMLRADLDKDGTEDLLVLEFGFETGQVKWRNGRTGIIDTLTTQPGARNVILRDVNQDGLPDLYILFAQAREQVSLFVNQGSGHFKSTTLLQFPPVHGSSYMEIADMNGDGREDLVLTNGDNADYSLSQKYFHGVRIYLNDGKGGYAEKWFYPVHGATKTIVKDFDNDGDPDMAMIAFFSDRGGGESFLYFENTGNMKFQVKDQGVPEGLWLVMEADDMEGDGDMDIILGNFQFGPEKDALPTRRIKALVLRNETRH
jgi:hypothetical protein